MFLRIWFLLGITKTSWGPAIKVSPGQNKNSPHSYLCLSINQDAVDLRTVAKKLVIKIWEYWLFQVHWKISLRKLKIKNLRKAKKKKKRIRKNERKRNNKRKKQTLQVFPRNSLISIIIFHISANVYPKSFTCLTASRSTLKIFLWSSEVLVALLKYFFFFKKRMFFSVDSLKVIIIITENWKGSWWVSKWN